MATPPTPVRPPAPRASAPSNAVATRTPANGAAAPVNWKDFYDAHITVGLIDERVRLKRVDYHALQIHFLAAREDVLLILHRPESECTLVLSGKDSVRVFTVPANPNAKAPLATVRTLDEMRRQMIAHEAQKQPARPTP